jgi:hypothetical protein
MEQANHEQAKTGAFQPPTNPLPTGYVFHPPITPWRWNRPTQGWNPAALFDRLKAQRMSALQLARSA